ncbi:MAG: primosomal protein N' [Glaciecola sp.]|jgi:primosomal protein N' (replication factor Y)
MHYLEVAVPVPLRKTFHYTHSEPVAAGCRVEVRFANRTLVGMVVGQASQTDIDPHLTSKIQAIQQVLDDQPVMTPIWLSWLGWLTQYYHHPIGEVAHAMLPAGLRKANNSRFSKPPSIVLREDLRVCSAEQFATHVDVMSLRKRAKKQHTALTEVFAAQQQAKVLSIGTANKTLGSAAVKGLLEKGLLQQVTTDIAPLCWHRQYLAQTPCHLTPNVEQALAISSLSVQLDTHFVALLEGITGSGKTEVYLQVIAEVLAAGKQVLILVPEIGLTPQTVARFAQRFGIEVGVLHSGLNDNERLLVWHQARHHEIGLVIGTRSAIFTPFANLGLIIIDEEHDDSFKQQDGLRYHARDVAIVLAQRLTIPIILGTATPSLETLYNAKQGKFQHFQLQQRAGGAVKAEQVLINTCQQNMQYGMSDEAIGILKTHLEQGNQVLVFMNRRGYAPAVVCQTCGEVHLCQACDKAYTYHQYNHSVLCHQCLDKQPMPNACKTCGGQDLLTAGSGTEQLKHGLQALFPQYQTVRIDSDSMRGKQKLAQTLDAINAREYHILVGTQILAKGHHFAHVTCVLILDVDSALYSGDFRAPEKLAQLVTQIGGRAGRASKPGSMYLQTAQPGHPLLQDLVNNGYQHFAEFALHERRAVGLPPYAFQAVLRAEDPDVRKCLALLQYGSGLVSHMQYLQVLGPLPCTVEKRQNRYRYCLVLQATKRTFLQKVLTAFIPEIETRANQLRIRWSIDVDNIDFS